MQKKHFVNLAIIVVPFLALAAICVLLLCSVFSNMCGNTLVTEISSPGGDLKAVLFTRDCGATTGYSYHVSILNQWQQLSNDEAGNIFVSDGSASINWKDNRTLLINRSTKASTYKEANQIDACPAVLPKGQSRLRKHREGCTGR